MIILRITIFCAVLLAFQQVVLADEDFQLPEDELAKESVVPKFDNSVSVKNKSVRIGNRLEVGPYYGWNFTEPIYNQGKLGVNLGYHWSEDAGIMFNFAKWMTGLNTQYTDAMAQPPGSGGGSLDMNRAPKIEYSLWSNYEITAYYGKLSLTKQGVLNVSLYPILGVGVTKFTHKMYFGANAGVGWKFYFSPNWALRTDLKIQYIQQPSPFLRGFMRSTDPQPTADQFPDKWTLGTILDVGLTFMF